MISTDTDGLLTASVDGNVYYRISDLVPTSDELEGGTVTVTNHGTGEVTNIVLSTAEGTIVKNGSMTYVTDLVLFHGGDNTFPETGFWIIDLATKLEYSQTFTVSWGNN